MNMMNNEYVVINKTELLKEIERLEWSLNHIPESYIPRHEAQIVILKKTISQSTPFIPEIEKAFDAGIDAKLLSVAKINCTVEDYISNLKLDI